MPENQFVMYKDKPLVRKGNEIYYGDMSEPFVVRFEILSAGKNGKNEVPDKINIRLLKSDTELDMKERTVKETVRNTMFDALDVGFVWLERALKD